MSGKGNMAYCRFKYEGDISMKKLFSLLTVVLLLTGCTGNPSVQTSEPVANTPVVETDLHSETPFDMATYMEMVEEFHKHVANNALAIGNMGVWETNFLETLGRTSDDMTEKAFEWLEENSDYTKDGVMEEDQAILDGFSAIVAATTSDEANELFLLVKGEYDCYIALYATVTEVPYSVSAFGQEMLDNFNALADSMNAMNDYLGLSGT